MIMLESEDQVRSKRKKSSLIFFVLMITGLLITAVTISNIVVKATNVYYIYNMYFSDSDLDAWTIYDTGYPPYLDGDGKLYLESRSAMTHFIDNDDMVNNWTLNVAFAIDDHTEWGDKVQYIFMSSSSSWSSDGSGYQYEKAYIQHLSNGTYRMVVSGLYDSPKYNIYNILPNKLYQINFNMHESPIYKTAGWVNCSYSSYNGVTWDFEGWICQEVWFNHNQGGYDHYYRVGTSPPGSDYSGGMWIDWFKLFYDDGNSIYVPPVDDDDTPDVYDDTDYISLVVFLLLFFLPIAVLTFALGRIGFIGGVALMTIVFTFSFSNFLYAGVINLIALGVMLLRGGVK